MQLAAFQPARKRFSMWCPGKRNARERDGRIDFLVEKNSTGVRYKPLYLHLLLKQGREYPVANRE